MVCYVFGCRSSEIKRKMGKSSVSYHRFPVDDPDLCQQWIDFCKRHRPFNFDSARICSLHFTDNDYERNLRYEMGFSPVVRKLKPGSVPSIFKTKIKKKPKPDQAGIAAEFISPDDVINIKTDELIKWNPTECCAQHRTLAAREKKLRTKTERAKNSSNADVPTSTAKASIFTQHCLSEKSQEENDPLQLNQDDSTDADPERCMARNAAKESLLTQVKELQKRNRSLKLNENDQMKIIFVTPTRDHLKQIKMLQRQTALLQTSIYKLQTRLTKCTLQKNDLESQLLKVFSKAQVNKLRRGGEMVHWSRADMLKSLKLFHASKKVYHMLLHDKYPLPSLRTLQRFQKMEKEAETLVEEIEEDDFEIENGLSFDDIIYEDHENDEDEYDQTIPIETVVNDHAYVIVQDSSLF